MKFSYVGEKSCYFPGLPPGGAMGQMSSATDTFQERLRFDSNYAVSSINLVHPQLNCAIISLLMEVVCINQDLVTVLVMSYAR